MSKELRHFDATEWIEYVRGQLFSEREQEMRSHLQAGCPECVRDRDWWVSFGEICKADARHEVPAHVERSVKALFAWKRQPKVSVLKRMWASLVYDSLQDLQPVGIRAAGHINRHLLFESGDYAVDLRFEHEKGSSNMVLVGQIVNRKIPEDSMGHRLVALFSGSREL